MENREQKQKERHCRFPLSGIMRLKALRRWARQTQRFFAKYRFRLYL